MRNDRVSEAIMQVAIAGAVFLSMAVAPWVVNFWHWFS